MPDEERVTCEELLARTFERVAGGGGYRGIEPRASDLSPVILIRQPARPAQEAAVVATEEKKVG